MDKVWIELIVALTSWPAAIIALALILRPKKKRPDPNIYNAQLQQTRSAWPELEGALGYPKK